MDNNFKNKQFARMSEYICRCCNKSFHQKFNFDRHFVCCDFFHKTLRQRNNEVDVETDTIPTMRDMYSLMQDLVVRVDKLEKENAKYRQIQNKKVNVADWLNTKAPPAIVFSRWIKDILFPYVKECLPIVFEVDLYNGVVAAFTKAIASMDESQIPFKAYDGRTINFYVFDHPKNQEEQDPPRWYKITSTEFDRYLAKIDHQFLVDFNRNWYCLNKHRMETEESFKDKYIAYHKAILGGDRLSDESRHSKIRHRLYENIRRRINAVTEIGTD